MVVFCDYRQQYNTYMENNSKTHHMHCTILVIVTLLLISQMFLFVKVCKIMEFTKMNTYIMLDATHGNYIRVHMNKDMVNQMHEAKQNMNTN